MTPGLVPRQHSTGGKQRLGATTKMGEGSLRRLLIAGANSVIIKRHAHAALRPGMWRGGMLSRRPSMDGAHRLSPDGQVAVWSELRQEAAPTGRRGR